MLIFQIFWRMYVALLIFELAVFPLTYLLPNEPEFIKWKMTFYYGLFGVALIIFGVLLKKRLIGLVNPKGINIPEFIWLRIDIYYSMVFIILAIINAWYALFMTEDQWVDFKLFVPFPVLVFYTIIVSLLVSKNIIKHEQKDVYQSH